MPRIGIEGRADQAAAYSDVTKFHGLTAPIVLKKSGWRETRPTQTLAVEENSSCFRKWPTRAVPAIRGETKFLRLSRVISRQVLQRTFPTQSANS